MQGDPPIRRDGRCAVCSGRRGEIARRNLDPFCRTECAKLWHDPDGPPSPAFLRTLRAETRLAEAMQ